MKKTGILIGLLLIMSGTAQAQVATGGTYQLDQSVIAGGGGTSAIAGDTFSVTGSIGQSVTDTSGRTAFTVKSGFFTAVSLVPTAAAVTVSGRILTDDGRGIRNALVTITDSSGSTRTAISLKFGYYRFTEVAAGETYVITVRARRFTFSQPSQVLNVNEDARDVDFIAAPNGAGQEIF